MNVLQNLFFQKLSILSLSSIFWLSCLPANANPRHISTGSPPTQQIFFNEDFAPPGNPAPSDTRGAGTRTGGQCAPQETPWRSLMPARNYGLTLETHPKIFVNLPATSAQQVVLSFQDEAGSENHYVFLPVPPEGIVSFQLPANVSALQVGKNYQWHVVLVCGTTVQPDDPVLSGWVQRVEPTQAIAHPLTHLSPAEQMQWYSAHGYWYDMLLTLSQARESYPELWQEFVGTTKIGGVD